MAIFYGKKKKELLQTHQIHLETLDNIKCVNLEETDQLSSSASSISSLEEFLSEWSNDDKKEISLVEILHTVKEAFKSLPAPITEQGTKNPYPHGNFTFKYGESTPYWQTDLQVIGKFKYVLRRLAQDLDDIWLMSNWSLIIPPLVTLLDSDIAKFRLEGVICLSLLLRCLNSDLQKLNRTGLDELFWNTCIANMSYLPPSTKQNISIFLIRNSFMVLISLIPHMRSKNPTELLDQLFVSIVRIISYSVHVDITSEAMISLSNVLDLLGLESVAYISETLHCLEAILTDVAACRSLDLVSSSLDTLYTLCMVSWPRITNHIEQIIFIMATCTRNSTLNVYADNKIKQCIDALRVLDDDSVTQVLELVSLKDYRLKSLFASIEKDCKECHTHAAINLL